MHTRFQILILFVIGHMLLVIGLAGCRTDEVIYPTIGTHVTDEVREGDCMCFAKGTWVRIKRVWTI